MRGRQVAQRLFVLFFACLYFSTMARAQSSFTRVYGSTDRDVPLPAAAAPLGRYDSAALSEIVEHLKVVGTGPWTDLQGTGQITYPAGGSGDSEVDSAVLSVLGARNFRLDVTTPKGIRSTRIAWHAGAILDTDGTKAFLPEATAAFGLVEFPRVRAEDLSGGNASVIDDGFVTVNGQALHRISLVYPFIPVSARINPASQALPALKPATDLAVDLYFDPTSHLLIESAELIKLAGAGNQQFLRCTSYGDYRQVGGSLIPYRYIQSLNGETLWVLQLNEARLGVGLTASSFHF